MKRKQQVGYWYRVNVDTPEKVLPTDGIEFSLPELQKFVGGYIELVPGARPIAYCNEEGLIHNLPQNKTASLLFKQALFGDVIQVVREAT